MDTGAARRASRLIGLAFALLLAGAWLAAAPAAEAVRHLCANHRSQASAQAAYRADPSLQPTLDPGRTGIACPNLPGPFDRVPVRAAAAPRPAVPAPARPAPPAAVRLPRTGGGEVGVPGAIGGLALTAVALGAALRAVSRRAR
jgi:hypothetical protein